MSFSLLFTNQCVLLSLQEQLSHASSDESKEIAQTEVLVSVDQNGLESAPEEISTLEIQVNIYNKHDTTWKVLCGPYLGGDIWAVEFAETQLL